MKCSGANQACGAASALSVYMYTPVAPSSTTTTSTTATTASTTATTASTTATTASTTATTASTTATTASTTSTATSTTSSTTSTTSSSTSTSSSSGALPSSTNGPFWNSLGCFADAGGNRTLGTQVYSNSSNNNAFCQATCRSKGTRFAATDYGAVSTSLRREAWRR